MITYEITTQVRSDLVENYEAYMRDKHISDVLATGLFLSASFSRAGEGRYRIRYEAIDQESLDSYLRDCAGPLRQHFTDHFPEGIELSRENWTVLQQWSPNRDRGA